MLPPFACLFVSCDTLQFCFAMENSLSHDYVTEKVWEALRGGCLPIYFGAPNVNDYLPHPSSIIHYRDFGSPKALVAELKRLMADEARYNSHFDWRAWPLNRLNPKYQYMAQLPYGEHSQCLLCRYIKERKLKHLCRRRSPWSPWDKSFQIHKM